MKPTHRISFKNLVDRVEVSLQVSLCCYCKGTYRYLVVRVEVLVAEEM